MRALPLLWVALEHSGPCILSAVVESTGRARQTGSGPGPSKTARSCMVVAPLFRQREPEQLSAPLRDEHAESPHPQGRATTDQGGATTHMVHERTETYAGVGMSPRTA